VDTGDFRLISRRALNVLLSMPERHRYIRGMISWIGFKQKPILYERDLRFEGTTKYPFRKSLLFAIDAVTGFSNKPLALASSIGALGALFSLGALVFALISWSQGRAVAGWASIMACIGIIGSLQMVCLGIFGEYLGRLYEQSKNRPLFIVEDVVGRDRVDRKSEGT
jgi:dolichol-phosphate mannosyltransferase